MNNFIKDVHGNYLNMNTVQRMFVANNTVFADVGVDKTVIIREFNSKERAKNYLDGLMSDDTEIISSADYCFDENKPKLTFLDCDLAIDISKVIGAEIVTTYDKFQVVVNCGSDITYFVGDKFDNYTEALEYFRHIVDIINNR